MLPSHLRDLKARRRQADGLHHGRRLVYRFLVFRFGIRIGHDARADLDEDLPVLDQDRPDGDAEIHIPGEAEIADGAAVGTAPGRSPVHR